MDYGRGEGWKDASGRWAPFRSRGSCCSRDRRCTGVLEILGSAASWLARNPIPCRWRSITRRNGGWIPGKPGNSTGRSFQRSGGLGDPRGLPCSGTTYCRMRRRPPVRRRAEMALDKAETVRNKWSASGALGMGAYWRGYLRRRGFGLLAERMRS
jgi:hypothetical protein